MKYTLEMTTQAERFLGGLDKKTVDLILEKLDKLLENPHDRSLDIKKLVNPKTDFYRLRVRNIRVFYEIHKEKIVIKVVEIVFRTTTTYKRRRKK